MKKLKGLFENHPVLAYYFTTFLISWGGLAVLFGGPSNITAQPTQIPFITIYLITVAGPSVAGIVLTGLINGRNGYKDFLLRLVKWRVGANWYAIALLAAPFTVFASLFILSLFSPVFIPALFISGDHPAAVIFGLPGDKPLILISFVLMLGIFNGFVEELGWTGFLTPRLDLKQHLFTSGLSLGCMWGLWHLVSNYIGISEGAGTVPILIYLPVILFSFLPPFRILMVWVYQHTQSFFISLLMHTSLDVFWLLSIPKETDGQQRMIWYVTWSLILWGLVAVVYFKKKPRSTI